MLISLSRSRPFFDRNVSPDTLFIELRGPDNARDVRLPIHYINIPLYKLHPIEFVIHLVSFIWYFPLCHMDMAWQKDCYMFPYYQCNWTFVCQSYFLKGCITIWQFTSIIYQRLHIFLNFVALVSLLDELYIQQKSMLWYDMLNLAKYSSNY